MREAMAVYAYQAYQSGYRFGFLRCVKIPNKG